MTFLGVSKPRHAMPGSATARHIYGYVGAIRYHKMRTTRAKTENIHKQKLSRTIPNKTTHATGVGEGPPGRTKWPQAVLVLTVNASVDYLSLA